MARDSNRIHSTALIGSGVFLGDGNDVGPYAVIHDGVVIGNNNVIGAHSVIGGPPEISGWDALRIDEDNWPLGRHGHGVRIGHGNDLREFVSLQAGSVRATTLGNHCFLMSHVHVSHDCQLADQVAISGGASLAGHVSIGRGANLGLNSAVHQFRVIGAGAMIGMGAAVVADIPNLCKAVGVPARIIGLNRVLLQRLGIVIERIDGLEDTARNSGWRLPDVDSAELMDLLDADSN